MKVTEIILIILNLAVGIGFAFPVARTLGKLFEKQRGLLRYFAICLLIYLLECAAVVLGMGIPVFSIGLAFVWGAVLGFWLRDRAGTRALLNAVFRISVYTCLPVISFIIVPIASSIEGWNVLSNDEGYRFGIPDFLHLPRPFNTILGFYCALITIALLFKIVITMGEVSLLIHLKSAGREGKESA